MLETVQKLIGAGVTIEEVAAELVAKGVPQHIIADVEDILANLKTATAALAAHVAK